VVVVALGGHGREQTRGLRARGAGGEGGGSDFF
jgi:hypothetical protein